MTDNDPYEPLEVPDVPVIRVHDPVEGYEPVPMIEAVGPEDGSVRVYIEQDALGLQNRSSDTFQIRIETSDAMEEHDLAASRSGYPKLDAVMNSIDETLQHAAAGVIRSRFVVPDTYIEAYDAQFTGYPGDITTHPENNDQNMFKYLIGGRGGRKAYGFGSHQTAEEELFRIDESFPQDYDPDPFEWL